jgi:hypothetical protein
MVRGRVSIPTEDFRRNAIATLTKAGGVSTDEWLLASLLPKNDASKPKSDSPAAAWCSDPGKARTPLASGWRISLKESHGSDLIRAWWRKDLQRASVHEGVRARTLNYTVRF